MRTKPGQSECVECADDCRQLRGSLEKLPVKIRYRIYRLALGGDAENTRYALAPPALGAVSRQIRGEVLPIYYAESTFSVALPLEDWAWERFTRWCESGPVREHLARIPAAIFFHRMKIGDDAGNVWEVTVGFDMIGRTQRELADHRLHICQRDEAWGSLVEDFYLSFDQDDTIPQRILDEFPLGRLVDVLCALAPLCTRANQQIMLVKDCDEWEN